MVCGLQFTTMPLSVVEGEANHTVAGFKGQCGCCGGVKAPGEQGNRGVGCHHFIQNAHFNVTFDDFFDERKRFELIYSVL